MVCFIQDDCESVFMTINLHLLHHVCDDWRKLCSIQVLDSAPYENFNVVLKRAYNKSSMRRVTRMQGTASASKRILRGLKERRNEKI